MKRVLVFEQGQVSVLGQTKYVLVEGDESNALYQEKIEDRYRVHQSWLLVLDGEYLVCESFNHKCKEEMLDLMDDFREKGFVKVKGFRNAAQISYMHPNGKMITI